MKCPKCDYEYKTESCVVEVKTEANEEGIFLAKNEVKYSVVVGNEPFLYQDEIWYGDGWLEVRDYDGSRSCELYLCPKCSCLFDSLTDG